MKFKLFLASFLFGFGFAFLALIWPGPSPRDALVYIPPNSPTRYVAGLLKELGIVRSSLLFEAWVRLTGRDIKAGEYKISARTSLGSVVRTLHEGSVYLRKITFPEGLTSAEIVERLKKEPLLTGTVETIPPEGTLWPETYTFARGETRKDVLLRMQKAMQDNVGKLWQEKPAHFPLKTMEQLVILASIVEKEASRFDRLEVASVFLNRLRNRIPLQADACVVYAISKKYPLAAKRALTQADLRMRDPYNTYMVPGLPPGPICNPGREALEAVLQAKKSKNFYFVLSPDGERHSFSPRLSEHYQNVRQWQKNVRARKL